MLADFFTFFGILVGSLVILDVLAARFGADSRPIDQVRWI